MGFRNVFQVQQHSGSVAWNHGTFYVGETSCICSEIGYAALWTRYSELNRVPTTLPPPQKKRNLRSTGNCPPLILPRFPNFVNFLAPFPPPYSFSILDSTIVYSFEKAVHSGACLRFRPKQTHVPTVYTPARH